MVSIEFRCSGAASAASFSVLYSGRKCVISVLLVVVILRAGVRARLYLCIYERSDLPGNAL